MSNTTCNLLRISALALAGIAFAGVSRAQDAYPIRPIRMVNPFAAGSGFDNIVRVLVKKMSEDLGQSIVVDNVPGAGGLLGSQQVARATPDGYTLIFQSVSSAVIAPATNVNLKYDPVKGFAPISLISQYPLLLVVNSSATPAKTLGEYIAELRAKPNAYNYGSSGVGSGLHLAGELFKVRAGVAIEHVPYKGTALAETDLLAGRIQMLFASPASTLPRVNAGALRPLAVTTLKRTPLLPNIPTMAEAGVPDFNLAWWNAIYAPAGTPKAIVDKLAASAAKAMRDPGMVATLKDQGADPIGSTPLELARFHQDQLNLFVDLVRKTNIQLQN